jgi:hypothetical protein
MEGSQPSEFPPLSPLILIQEYPETGGAFFYTCFHIMDHFDKANLKQIFLNIIQKQRQHEVRPALVNLESIEQVVILKRQLQIMKVLLILAMLGVGLLVSRLWFPGTDFDSLLKTIVTMAVTGLVGLLMTQFQKWFSGPDSSS